MTDEIGDLRSELENLQKKEFEIENKIERLIQSGERQLKGSFRPNYYHQIWFFIRF